MSAAVPSHVLPRDAVGLGFRMPFVTPLRERDARVDYFEIITENFLDERSATRRHLDWLVERAPVVLHGVSLDLLGESGPDPRYLDRVAALAEAVRAPFVTDHLCWTSSSGHSHHDLLPVPYVEDLIELAARRAHVVRTHLGRPFGLENLSSYVEFRRSTMSEWEFFSSVVRESGCHALLDVNNVYVSCENHGLDADEYVRAIDFSRVLQIHLAGHAREPNGTIVDTHDHPVADAVWALYERALRLGGPVPTLLEWDDRLPPFEVIEGELAQIRRVRARVDEEVR